MPMSYDETMQEAGAVCGVVFFRAVNGDKATPEVLKAAGVDKKLVSTFRKLADADPFMAEINARSIGRKDPRKFIAATEILVKKIIMLGKSHWIPKDTEGLVKEEEISGYTNEILIEAGAPSVGRLFSP